MEILLEMHREKAQLSSFGKAEVTAAVWDVCDRQQPETGHSVQGGEQGTATEKTMPFKRQVYPMQDSSQFSVQES